MIWRALRKRCPLCGGGHIFSSWSGLVERCPNCGHRFEREQGYWVGAIIVNTAVTEALFGILFVAILIVTIPDIPWQPVLAAAVLTNGLFPWFFYPRSKTVWMAIDLYFSPPRGSHP